MRSMRPLLVTVAVMVTLALTAACSGGDGDEASSAGDATTPTSAAATAERNAISGPPDEAEPRYGGQVVWGLESEPDSMNTAFGRFASSGHLVASSVFDPLVTIAEDGAYEPYVAESLTPNDDFTEWTITVREGITFHDGTPLDAAAVKANFDLHKQSIVTAKGLLDIARIDLVDERTLLVTTTQRWATFPWGLTLQVGYIMAPAMLTDGTKAAAPIGSGPFRFQSWTKGEEFSAVRNDDYWRTDDAGRPLPYLDTMSFRFIPDAVERAQALETGDVDVIHGYESSVVDAVRANPDYKVVENSLGEEHLIALNNQAPPFDNLDARQAVVHSADTAAWREAAGGAPLAADSPFAPGQLGYAEDSGYPEYDLTLAKEHLDKYLAETGETALRFEYMIPPNPDSLAGAQALVDGWAQIGIEAQVVTIPQADEITRVVFGQFQASDWRNWGSPDPDGDYIWWHSKSISPACTGAGTQCGATLNVSRVDDDQVDAALDRGRNSPDEAERDAAYQDFARRMNELATYVILGRARWVAAANPRVNGLYAAANGTLQSLGNKTWLAQMWVSEAE